MKEDVVNTARQARVLVAIVEERDRQDAKWGEQNHPDDAPGSWWVGSPDRGAAERRAEHFEVPSEHRAKFLIGEAARRREVTWPHILIEEVAEAVAVVHDPAKLRAELVQVAAVAVAWIEALDRRSTP